MQKISEAEFQQMVTDYCDWLGLRWHHETDSRRSKGGFPDLVIVGPGGIWFLELKAEKGRVSSEQKNWIADLHRAGVHASVARPSQWESVQQHLRMLATA